MSIDPKETLPIIGIYFALKNDSPICLNQDWRSSQTFYVLAILLIIFL